MNVGLIVLVLFTGFTKAASTTKGWQFNDKLVVPSMGTKLAEMRAEGKKTTADNSPQVLPGS